MVELASSRFAQLLKFRRSIAAAKAVNPVDSAVAIGVTQAVNSTYDTVTLTKYVDMLTQSSKFRSRGGKRTVSGGGTATYPVASILPATSGNLGSDKQAWGWSETFWTEASKLAIHVFSSAASAKGFRVLVDGKYVNKSWVDYGVAAGSAYVTLDFSSVRAPRKITLEGSVQDGFRGVYVPPTEEVWADKATSDKIVWLAAGDSYSEGQGAAYPGQASWVQHAARMLFTDCDLRQVAVGGTGFVSNGSTRSAFIDQIANFLSVNSDLAASDVDLLTVAFGLNDRASGGPTTGAAATTGLAALRAVFANARIAVLGSFTGINNNDATTLAIENAVSAAVTAQNDNKMTFIPVSTDVPPWQTGTGKVGTTAGSGNGDFDLSSDGTHPSDAGHMMIARRFSVSFANQILSAI